MCTHLIVYSGNIRILYSVLYCTNTGSANTVLEAGISEKKNLLLAAAVRGIRFKPFAGDVRPFGGLGLAAHLPLASDGLVAVAASATICAFVGPLAGGGPPHVAAAAGRDVGSGIADL